MKGYRKEGNKFRAEIFIDKKHVGLGTYDTEEEAMNAYREAYIKRIKKGVIESGHKIEDGVWYKNDYIVFPDGVIIGKHGRIVKPHRNERGYMSCDIHGHNERIHRIVAMCFIPNLENKNDVNHINGNKTDNRAENLEWVTHQENMRHAFDTKLATNRDKKRDVNPRAKLSNDDIAYIKTHYIKYDKEWNSAVLAKKFGVSQNTILKFTMGL